MWIGLGRKISKLEPALIKIAKWSYDWLTDVGLQSRDFNLGIIGDIDRISSEYLRLPNQTRERG